MRHDEDVSIWWRNKSNDVEEQQTAERKYGQLISAIVDATEQNATLSNEIKIGRAATWRRKESSDAEDKQASERTHT